jgi:hypothetical protein
MPQGTKNPTKRVPLIVAFLVLADNHPSQMGPREHLWAAWAPAPPSVRRAGRLD